MSSVLQPYAFHKGRRITTTLVALNRNDYKTLEALTTGRYSDAAFEKGLKITFNADRITRTVYAQRSCCALQGWTIAQVSKVPGTIHPNRVAHRTAEVGGISIGSFRAQVEKRFGPSTIQDRQLVYEQSPRPGTAANEHCVTDYTFTFSSDRVVAMDFQNAC